MLKYLDLLCSLGSEAEAQKTDFSTEDQGGYKSVLNT